MLTIQQYEDEDTNAQAEFKEMSDKVRELEEKLAACSKHHSTQQSGLLSKAVPVVSQDS